MAITGIMRNNYWLMNMVSAMVYNDRVGTLSSRDEVKSQTGTIEFQLCYVSPKIS